MINRQWVTPYHTVDALRVKLGDALLAFQSH